MSEPTRIFISYAHKNTDWLEAIRDTLAPLVHGRVISTWWDGDIAPGAKWEKEIDEALESAELAILLVSLHSLASEFIRDVEMPYLFRAADESRIRLLWIPVTDSLYEVTRLREFQALHDPKKPLNTLGEGKLDQALVEIARKIARLLMALPSELRASQLSASEDLDLVLTQTGREIAALLDDSTPPPETVKTPSLRRLQRVTIARLPTTSATFEGRTTELETLDHAWADPHTHILSIVAPGGVGKTALVNTWLGKMAREDYRGARRVYGWSFYSQGSGEEKTAASGDAFLAEALAFFGDPDPETGSPWQRGERLAGLVRQESTLLVLDGLEPLQEPPRTGLPAGRLKDPGLRALLRNLAAQNNGLCLITTREKVDDLDSRVGTTVERHDLNELPPEAGAAVLRAYKVKGPEKELREVSTAFAGHALALTLLATYLRDVCGGEIRGWKEVPILEEATEQGGHAIRVMKSYESRLGKGPELSVLCLLGLFDRPASKEEIEALLAEPAIPGLTEELVKGGAARWMRAVSRLREARLVSGEGGLGKEGGLDAHPLVRTYFGELLEKQRPKAFRAGHLRLYEYLKQAAPEFPEDLKQMQPLYHAVIHGCRGGRVQEAMDDVYWPRIKRREEHFSTQKLGAFGSDLAALSGFFEHPWDRPVAELREGTKGFVLNEAGFGLRAQGRLAEAVAPMRAGVDLAVEVGNLKNGAAGAGSLSELLLTLGRVEEAVSAARESVELADRSGDAFQRMLNRTTLADALHQAARVEEARSLFEEAEAMQAERQPQYPLLYSLQGYQYCDLLLALTSGPALTPPTPLSQPWPPPSREMGELALSARAEVARGVPSSPDSPLPGVWEGGSGEGPGVRAIRQRAEQTITWVKNLLSIALDHLTLGGTHLYLALTARPPQPDPIHIAQATDHLDRAVEGLRDAGQFQEIPRGLLARAALCRWTDQPGAATADLDEAFEIAERGGMRLHLTDAHLERARLRVHVREIDEARADVEAARGLVGDTGYHRRDSEVAALEAILNG